MPSTSQQEALTTLLFAGAAGLAIALAAFTFWMAREQDAAAAQVSHTHEVLAAIGELRSDVGEIQSGPRGYVITGREDILALYEQAVSRLPRDLARVRTLTADNASQQALLESTFSLLQARLATARQIIATRRDAGFEAAAKLVQSDVPRQQIEAMRTHLDQMAAAEQKLLEHRLLEQKRQANLFWVALSAFAAVLAIALALVYAMIRRRQREAQRARAELEDRVRERTARLDEANQRLLCEIDERRAVERELREARQRLESLSKRLVSSNEDERRRIARDLHDQTGQSLSLMLQNLRMLRLGYEAKRVDEAVLLTEDMIRQVRDMSLQLRPPMLDDLGLDAAVEWLLERHGNASGWKTTLELDAVPEDLADDVRTECFRIAQEALNNVAKHAAASNVYISVKAGDGELRLVVRDDGRGFSAEQLRSSEERARHFGMVSMSERAELVGGRLDIAPAPGSGTQVEAVFPLRAQGA